MAIRFQWCRSLGAADFPVSAYEQLRTQVADATPFNTLAWLQAAEFALLPEQQLHVLLGWRDQTLCLCLPLISGLERIGGLGCCITWVFQWPIASPCWHAWTPKAWARR